MVYGLQKPCYMSYNTTLGPNVCPIIPFIIKNKCSSSKMVSALPPLKFFLNRGPSDIPSYFLAYFLLLPLELHIGHWHNLSSYHECPHSLWLCFSGRFLIKFIFQLSSLFDLHLLIPISVSDRNDYFCFDSANHLIWFLHLQVPFSWLPPSPLIPDNAPTCHWLLNWIDFFVVSFIAFTSYSIIHFVFSLDMFPSSFALLSKGPYLRPFPMPLPQQNQKVSREKPIRIDMFTFIQQYWFLLTEMYSHVYFLLFFAFLTTQIQILSVFMF